MEDSKKWMDLSERDMETAKKNKDIEEYEAAAFFCHQAAEKALKAVYISKYKNLKKTHDLFLLAEEVNAEELKEVCRELTPAYLYTRYPDVENIENIKELVDDFIDYSKQVIEWSKKQL